MLKVNAILVEDVALLDVAKVKLIFVGRGI